MTKSEYLTYVSLYMAEIDTKTTESELAFIKEKAGYKTYEKVKAQFDSADEIERVNTIRNTAETLNFDKTTLQAELKYLSDTDGKFTSNENYLINFIVKLLG